MYRIVIKIKETTTAQIFFSNKQTNKQNRTGFLFLYTFSSYSSFSSSAGLFISLEIMSCCCVCFVVGNCREKERERYWTRKLGTKESIRSIA